RIRVGENSFPSRAALRLVSATFSATLLLSRCALICARRALSADRSAERIRRFSLRAAYLASSFARRFNARASARRVARLLRLLNRPIPRSPPDRLVDMLRIGRPTLSPRWWGGFEAPFVDLVDFSMGCFRPVQMCNNGRTPSYLRTASLPV